MRMGPKGQVVVPKAIRERVGIHPGDDLQGDEVDGGVRIRRPHSFGDVRGTLGPAVGMADVDELKRREEEDDTARESR